MISSFRPLRQKRTFPSQLKLAQVFNSTMKDYSLGLIYRRSIALQRRRELSTSPLLSILWLFMGAHSNFCGRSMITSKMDEDMMLVSSIVCTACVVPYHIPHCTVSCRIITAYILRNPTQQLEISFKTPYHIAPTQHLTTPTGSTADPYSNVLQAMWRADVLGTVACVGRFLRRSAYERLETASLRGKEVQTQERLDTASLREQEV